MRASLSTKLPGIFQVFRGSLPFLQLELGGSDAEHLGGLPAGDLCVQGAYYQGWVGGWVTPPLLPLHLGAGEGSRRVPGTGVCWPPPRSCPTCPWGPLADPEPALRAASRPAPGSLSSQHAAQHYFSHSGVIFYWSHSASERGKSGNKQDDINSCKPSKTYWLGDNIWQSHKNMAKFANKRASFDFWHTVGKLPKNLEKSWKSAEN